MASFAARYLGLPASVKKASPTSQVLQLRTMSSVSITTYTLQGHIFSRHFFDTLNCDFSSRVLGLDTYNSQLALLTDVHTYPFPISSSMKAYSRSACVHEYFSTFLEPRLVFFLISGGMPSVLAYLLLLLLGTCFKGIGANASIIGG